MADINSSVSGVASGIARSYDINIVDDSSDIGGTVILMAQIGSVPTELPHLKNICRRSNGTMFITYLKRNGANNTANVYVAESSDNGANWTSGIALTDGVEGGIFRHPNIVCTENDTLHLLVYDDDGASDEILHFTKATGESSWTEQTAVDTITGLEYFVAVAGDNNEIWIAADRGTTPEIRIYHYNGTSWGAAESPSIGGTSDTNISSQDVDLAVDKDGNLHILWVKDNSTTPGEIDGLYYANSYDGPWASQLVVNSSSGMDPGTTTSQKHRMVTTLNDKIHVIYPSGAFTSDDLVYTNFDIPGSGETPTLITPMVIDPSVTDHQNFVGISADVRNRIYIGALDDDENPDVYNIYMSTDDTYSEFIKNTIDVDTGSQIPNRVYGFLSSPLPFIASARTNMPEKGLIFNYVNSTPNPDELYVIIDDILSFQDPASGTRNDDIDGYVFAAEPDQFVSGYIKGDILDQFVSGYMLAAGDDQFIDGFTTGFDVINTFVSGFIFAAQDDQFIDGFALGHDTINSQLSGVVTGVLAASGQISGISLGHDFINSQVSGYLFAAEPDQFIDGYTTGFDIINSMINGVLPPVFGNINSMINGIVSQNSINAQIFGFQGLPDVNSDIDALVLAANDDQFIDGHIETESGINSNIDGVITGVLFRNTQISGYVLADMLITNQINGFSLGDMLVLSDIDGYTFGISGIINDSINGFIRAAIESQINGYTFGVSGIINESINGISVGDKFKSDFIRGIVAGFVPPISPDEDCFIG